MSTVTNNNIRKGIVNGQGFLQHDSVPVNNSTFPIHQGDILWWDSGALLCKPVTSDGDAATLLGVALEPSAVTSNLDSPSAPAVANITVGYGAIAGLKSTAAETYNNGTLVYVGADAQTVTTVAGTNPVGVVRLASHQSAITGASGVLVPVLVYSKAFVKLAN